MAIKKVKKVTQKEIKEKYSPSQIIGVTNKTKNTRVRKCVYEFDTLEDIIEWGEYNEVDPIDIKIETGSFDDPEQVYFDVIEEKTEKERYDEGVRVLQERENKKLEKEFKEQREREELERLKKKFGEY